MMKFFYCALAFFAVSSISGFAQTSQRPIAKYGGSQRTTRMIELSNMAGDMTGCVKFPQPYVGTIVKRTFDDDEITLIGIVIRDARDERTYINVDAEQISRMTRFDLGYFSSFLGIGKRVKVWVYGCGASGGVLYADHIRSF